MREPDQIVTAARTRYWSSWRDVLTSSASPSYAFALNAPKVATITTNPDLVAGWLKRWRAWADEHSGVQLRPATVRTRFGDQPLHTHLDAPNLSALAGLSDDTAQHWKLAQTRWSQLASSCDKAMVRPWLHQIIALEPLDFDLLLRAAEWFRANPRSGLTIRRVPVLGMHTKWLARHRRLVIALIGQEVGATTEAGLSDVDPGDVPEAELDALGLRPLPREVDVVFLDPEDRARLGGLRQIRAPVNELAGLHLNPDAVLIVENKEAALALTDHAGLAVIHSLGNHLDVLGQIPWIPAQHTSYWGDLDRHGYTLLSRARTHLPGLRSLLMGLDAVTAYRYLSVPEAVDKHDAPEPTLTVEERSSLAALDLNDGRYLRTEQERLPLHDVLSAIAVSLGAHRD